LPDASGPGKIDLKVFRDLFLGGVRLDNRVLYPMLIFAPG